MSDMEFKYHHTSDFQSKDRYHRKLNTSTYIYYGLYVKIRGKFHIIYHLKSCIIILVCYSSVKIVEHGHESIRSMLSFSDGDRHK